MSLILFFAFFIVLVQSDPHVEQCGRTENILHPKWSVGVYDQTSDTIVCTASLIASRAAVTTASCVLFLLNSDHTFRVVANFSKDFEQREIILKMGNSMFRDDALVHTNIAVLILDQPFSSSYETLCLPSADQVFDGEVCVFTGYGHGEHPENESKTSMKTQNAKVLNPYCNLHEQQNVDLEGLLCVGEEGYKGGCAGDSGATLACQSREIRYVLAGLSTYGPPRHVCYTETPYPDLYTSVSHHLHWLSRTIPSDILNITTGTRGSASSLGTARRLITLFTPFVYLKLCW